MPSSYYDDVQRRIKIFRDTENLCWADSDLTGSIKETIARTKVYPPNQEPFYMPVHYMQAGISVTNERTLAAAARLHKKYPKCHIAVLNFASATNPGGGVKSGSAAQEESLCRCSTLYDCLNTSDLRFDFYKMHRRQNDLRYTDTCIYTPDVTVFKTDTRFPELMDEQDWFKVDVITCAAPNLRKIPYNRMNPGKGTALTLSDDELYLIHYNRAWQIARIAEENEAEILILGAFGCGAFNNNPKVVASVYRDLLHHIDGAFVEICFAVYCPPTDMTNYRVFKQVLKDQLHYCLP